MTNYSKIQEPCFVCKVEDKLGQERGTKSHPINCGWRVGREKKRYADGLEAVIDLCNITEGQDLEALIKQIKAIAVVALVHRYDIKKEGDINGTI